MSANVSKQIHGFDIAVLTYGDEGEALLVGVSPFSQNESNSGLLLVSNDSPEPVTTDKTKIRSKPKQTRNRKRVTFDDVFTRNGTDYQVNTNKSGLYVEPLVKIIEQFEVAQCKWGRVLVLRFDLHQDYFTINNKHITAFRKRLFQKLKREYGFDDIGFCWVREQERAKAQHYHFVLYLDGRLIRHSSRINLMIKEAWEKPTGGYHVPIIKRPFYFVNSDDSKQEAIYRISYLAKARGKGYRDKQVKDYQCSRMKA